MNQLPIKPGRDINWTKILADAGIPEPEWGKENQHSAPVQRVNPPDSEDRENWMHV